MTPYSPQQIVVALLVGSGIVATAGTLHVLMSAPAAPPSGSFLSSSVPPPPPPSSSGGPSRERKITLRTLLDINTATWEDLQTLPGIGAVLATRIVEYRQTHGRFTSADELTRVAGIGPRRLSQMSSLIRVGETP